MSELWSQGWKVQVVEEKEELCVAYAGWRGTGKSIKDYCRKSLRLVAYFRI